MPDAELYVQLFSITQLGYQAECRRWFFTHYDVSTYEELDAQYPEGSSERDQLVNVLMFFETVGVLVQRGLLDEEVFLSSPLGFDVVWTRLRPTLEAWRARSGPTTWSNVIWLGRRFDWWYENVWAPPDEARPPDDG
jgi:hypothetical protein